MQFREDTRLSEKGVGQPVRCGLTHTELEGRSVMALGHLINHTDQSMVRMIFVPLPKHFGQELLCLVPSVNASHLDRSRRFVVAIVALEDMELSEGEVGGKEIYFDYGHSPTTLGWQGPTAVR